MDIDIDFPTKFDPTTVFDNVVVASMVKDGELTKHPCGHYFQKMPVDGVTNLAAIPYEEAEVLGYTKIDFLHLTVLDHFKSKAEIRALCNLEPDWTLLEDPANIEKLMHLHNHVDLVLTVKPTSVIELADCITLIRPGKKKLLSMYLQDRELVRRTSLYEKTTTGYSFKKSHAISYALTIVLQMHLIELGKL